MADSFNKEFNKLDVNTLNIEELCEELNDTSYFYKDIAEGIEKEYMSKSSNFFNGDFRCINYTEDTLNSIYYVNAEFEYKLSASAPNSVYIGYGRIIYNIGRDDEEIKNDGPNFSPMKEEAPELYDDFLSWLEKENLAKYIGM